MPTTRKNKDEQSVESCLHALSDDRRKSLLALRDSMGENARAKFDEEITRELAGKKRQNTKTPFALCVGLAIAAILFSPLLLGAMIAAAVWGYRQWQQNANDDKGKELESRGEEMKAQEGMARSSEREADLSKTHQQEQHKRQQMNVDSHHSSSDRSV